MVCLCVCVFVFPVLDFEPLNLFFRKFELILCNWLTPQSRNLKYTTLSNRNMADAQIYYWRG
jgi:hypothetical protein